MQSFNDQANPPPRNLRVLVACEFSGIVRDAFLEKGHKAWPPMSRLLLRLGQFLPGIRGFYNSLTS
jgi:hypothetical protein